MNIIRFSTTLFLLVLPCVTFTAMMGEKVDNKADQKQLHPTIKKKIHHKWCSKLKWCGDLVSIDCHSATDGPLYYYNNSDGSLLMVCGGACLKPPHVTDPLQCSECPPKAWMECTSKQKSQKTRLTN